MDGWHQQTDHGLSKKQSHAVGATPRHYNRHPGVHCTGEGTTKGRHSLLTRRQKELKYEMMELEKGRGKLRTSKDRQTTLEDTALNPHHMTDTCEQTHHVHAYMES